ncbi:adenylate kinase [Actinidia chinensis var. chinensis]|uniref:Adenylate kinase n=1 Tax=Actinidia chinensis var. chinensis TaxID=1590841 RepID=A0A2R6QQ83_ACTCC|nr:adenylate kinase [Actinidia chinensis var. chinensis]
MATRALSAAFFVVPPKPKLSYSSSNLKFAAGPPPGWGGWRGSLYSSYRVSIGNGCVKCKAAGESSNPRAVQVYQGVFGPWTVDPSDVREVTLYRSGLVTAAASFVIAASAAFLPDNSLLGDIIKQNLDIFYAVGAGGLGLSLLLIHIYVTPIKRTLQAFWALGVLGSLATYISLAQPAGENLVEYVLDNPKAVLFVGPLFAALTGLVFKEGLCYGKLEAGILTFIIPSVLLGHLTGLMNDEVKVPLLGLWMTLFVIFAGRKFSQSIKDDIGDKSVFMFNALPEDQKNALVEKLRAEKVESEP